ncbi:hypothetical protein MtrunA17_Chr7g0235591 [Medicago truncatula]|uniref:Uncharacterized protein n=1 Tax=Medicago truncatula TaxID=3880 RepID=A0A396GXG3_MEDTR|nr:hypothetical protein MtrunA17_Chr7g0235591 [Medicago truncatula]
MIYSVLHPSHLNVSIPSCSTTSSSSEMYFHSLSMFIFSSQSEPISAVKPNTQKKKKH